MDIPEANDEQFALVIWLQVRLRLKLFSSLSLERLEDNEKQSLLVNKFLDRSSAKYLRLLIFDRHCDNTIIP